MGICRRDESTGLSDVFIENSMTPSTSSRKIWNVGGSPVKTSLCPTWWCQTSPSHFSPLPGLCVLTDHFYMAWLNGNNVLGAGSLLQWLKGCVRAPLFLARSIVCVYACTWQRPYECMLDCVDVRVFARAWACSVFMYGWHCVCVRVWLY